MGKKRTAGRADYVLGLNKSAFERGIKAAQNRFRSMGKLAIGVGSKFLGAGSAITGS